MRHISHKTVGGLMALCGFFLISGFPSNADAFCVYNKLSTNNRIQAYQKTWWGYHRSGTNADFSKKIKRGEKACCNYKDCSGTYSWEGEGAYGSTGKGSTKRTTLVIMEIKGGKLKGQGSWPKRGACGFTAGGWIKVYDNKIVCSSVDSKGKKYDSCTVSPPGKDWHYASTGTIFEREDPDMKDLGGKNFCITDSPADGWGQK